MSLRSYRYVALLFCFSLVISSIPPSVHAQQPSGNTGQIYLPLIEGNNDSGDVTPTPMPTSTPIPDLLRPLDDQTAFLGQTLRIEIAGQTTPQVPVSFNVAPLPLPENALFDAETGIFTFRPSVDQIGDYSLTFSAIAGEQIATESMTVTVPEPDPNAPTSLRGRILDANDAEQGVETPLVGATVRLIDGDQSITTDADGYFELANLTGEAQYVEFDGSTAMPAGTYGAYRSQQSLIPNVSNVIDRPIYIMAIDAGGMAQIEPDQTTELINPALGITLTIPANTVMQDDGSPYSGPISISEVPDEFTPGSLPENLDPSQVFTIQPMGLTFTETAPIIFPNSSNLPNGSEVDIWSMDHETSEFFVAGRGRVSGNVIETISGGIRESSWHLFLPLIGDLDLAPDNTDDNNEGEQCQIDSTVTLHNGCLRTDISLPAYTILGEEQGLEFIYSSKRAHPVPIIPLEATLPRIAATPNRISAGFSNFGGYTASSGGGGLAPAWISTDNFLDRQDNFIRVALPAPIFGRGAGGSGILPYNIRLTNHFEDSSVSTEVLGKAMIVDGRDSTFGAGWSLAGIDRIYLQSDETILLAAGSGQALRFDPDSDIHLTSITLYSADETGSVLRGSGTWNTWEFFGWVLGVAYEKDSAFLNNTDRTSPEHARIDIPLLKGTTEFYLFAQPTWVFDNPNHNFGINLFFNDSEVPDISARAKLKGNTFTANNAEHSLNHVGWPAQAAGTLKFTTDTDVSTVLTSFIVDGRTPGVDRVAAGTALFPQGPEDAVIRISLETEGKDEIDYIAAKGDYSKLRRNRDGTFTRQMKDGTVYSFNGNGLQTSMVDPNGNRTTYAYDGQERLTSITDPVGGVTTLSYGGIHLQSVTYPDGRTTTFTYDRNGNLISVTYPDGASQAFDYDSNHLMTSETDRRGNESIRTYDPYGRLTSATLPDGTIRQVSYSQSQGLIDPSTGEGTEDNPVLPTRPDEAVTKMTDGEGRTTIYGIGPLGRPDSITDPAGDTTTIQRDEDGNPLRIDYPSGAAYIRQYDDRGNVISFKDDTVNGTTTYTYEPVYNQVTTIADPFDQVTKFAYDASGNLTQVTTPLSRTVKLSYNQQGLPTSLTDPLGTQTSFTYDTSGNPTQISTGSGAATRNTKLTYTPEGYINQLTDPLGQSYSFTYDAQGRPTSETLPGSRTIAYSYDEDGNLTSLTPPGKPTHRFTYDSLGQVTSYIPPSVAGIEDATTTYAYNNAQELTKITQPGDGKSVNRGTIGYIYDNAGRITTITQGRGLFDFHYNYRYQRRTGLLIGVETQIIGSTNTDNTDLAYSYLDDLLTGTELTGPVAGTVGFTYDQGGRLASDSVNGANQIDYSYDADDALVKAGNLDLTYDTANGLLSDTTIGTIQDSYTYNDFAETSNYTASSADTTLYDVSYTYDALGRITNLSETIQGEETTYVYSYDAANRLESVTQNGTIIASYTYDANGNRLTGPNGFSGTYDDQDRLLSDGTASYTYQPNGELLTKTENGQTTTYDYDLVGNLKGVTLLDGRNITYIIDGQDRRVGKRVDSTLVQGFLYQDQLNPIAELDAGGNIVSRFVYASWGNVPDYMIRKDQTFRIISDHLGSVRLVVNTDTGEVAQRLNYDAWGNVTQDTNPGFQPFGFAGGIYDTDIGLTRFGARDYDAEVGRWASKDPIGFKGTDSNLHSYTYNDPINWIDPNGLTPAALCFTPPGAPVCASAAKATIAFCTKYGIGIAVLIGAAVISKSDSSEPPSGPFTEKVGPKDKLPGETWAEYIERTKGKNKNGGNSQEVEPGTPGNEGNPDTPLPPRPGRGK
ncbi:MAG: RHS repeat-associated core domain-containing protein [Chloroflexota bacterium]